jgi:hypothetical protein
MVVGHWGLYACEGGRESGTCVAEHRAGAQPGGCEWTVWIEGL